MKALQEIKEEVAKDAGYEKWSDLAWDCKASGEDMERYMEKVIEKYNQPAKATEGRTVVDINWPGCNHYFNYNVPSIPNKRICLHCKVRQQLDLKSLKWTLTFTDSRTDDELIKAWYGQIYCENR